MKCSPDKIYKSLMTMLAGVFFASAAFAQGPAVTVGSAAGAPGGMATVTVDYIESTSPDVTNFNLSILFDETMLTADLSNCGAGNAATANATITCGMTPGSINIVALNLAGVATGSGTLGDIIFTIDGGASPGTVFDLMVTGEVYSDPVGNAVPSAGSTDGSVVVEVAGVGFYVSTPAVGDTVNFPGAVVNGGTSAATINVQNVSSDTSFEITAVASDNAVVTSMFATPATVGAGMNVDVMFDCAPLTRGDNTGTITISNDSDNESPAADYPFSCPGLAPNVMVDPAMVGPLMGVSGGPAVSGMFDVSNPEDGFTSAAMNASIAGDGGSGGVITLAPTMFSGDMIGVDETETFTASCQSATAGSFTEVFTVTYDDPATGAPATVDVTVDCDVVDEVPEYASSPAVGSSIDFVEVLINTTSAPLGIDVSNLDTDAVPNSDLMITGTTITGPDAALFAATIANATVTAGTGFDGTPEIEITCSPTVEGDFTASLDVITNDVDGAAGTTATPHTYPLTCNAINEIPEYGSVPAEGSTLDFGDDTPNGVTSAPIAIDVNNLNTDTIPNGDLEVLTATVADTRGLNVFALAVDQTPFTLAEGDTLMGAFEVTCTPDAGFSGFTGTLTVTSDDPDSPHLYNLACGSVNNVDLVSVPAVGSTLDFGIVNAGATATQTILISADSPIVPADDLTISSCDIVGDGADFFTLINPSLPVTVTPGDAPVAFEIEGESLFGTVEASLVCETDAVNFVDGIISFDLTLTTTVAEVPTLSRFGLIALIMTLMMGGFIAFRLRQN